LGLTQILKRTRLAGLTSGDAIGRLRQFGPNSIPDASAHLVRSALGKFWAPVPWLLEAVIVLEVGLHNYVEASVIAVLLVFNAALSFFQESHAQATLAALKSRLALFGIGTPGRTLERRRGRQSRGRRHREVVAGGSRPADVRLVEGSVLIDQSMLTGESVPIEAGPGLQTYAGALVRRGEAVAEVTATGTRTKFGRTTELIRTAHVVSTQQKVVCSDCSQYCPLSTLRSLRCS
jgi:H+-transporting ATPase